jgi:hypothetical protein
VPPNAKPKHLTETETPRFSSRTQTTQKTEEWSITKVFSTRFIHTSLGQTPEYRNIYISHCMFISPSKDKIKNKKLLGPSQSPCGSMSLG